MLITETKLRKVIRSIILESIPHRKRGVHDMEGIYAERLKRNAEELENFYSSNPEFRPERSSDDHLGLDSDVLSPLDAQTALGRNTDSFYDEESGESQYNPDFMSMEDPEDIMPSSEMTGGEYEDFEEDEYLEDEDLEDEDLEDEDLGYEEDDDDYMPARSSSMMSGRSGSMMSGRGRR